MNRILVVDDEKLNLRAIERLFQDTAHILKTAGSGEEAMKLAPFFKPDVVILDIMMPGIDGYEVCRRLKSDPETSEVLVLMLSARDSLEDRMSGYRFEADDYLTKPYEPMELLAKVNILLRLKNAHDDLKIINRDLENLVELRTRELVKKERQALIGQLVQGFIHNLQSPIMAAQGRTEMALSLCGDLLGQNVSDLPEAADKTRDIIQELHFSLEAIDKVETLIQNLLVKSREEAAEEGVEIDLNDLIVKEMEFLQSDLKRKHGIKRTLNLHPDLSPVYGVYSDFSQVVYNMVGNASDAMTHAEEKELTIATWEDTGHIYMEFKDTGSGIPEEALHRIFDPFFTTKPKKGVAKEGEPTGTGLGLYTCRELMKPYHGTISIESRPGKGSSFTIVLPKGRD